MNLTYREVHSSHLLSTRLVNILFVPSGLKRYYGSGDLHFITSSCYHRQSLLGSDQRRDLFLSVLEQVRQRYGWVVLGYVVMPEHFHLLISEPERGTPSVVVQALKLGFARRVASPIGRDERRADPPVHIWQRRFYDFNLWSEAKRIEKLHVPQSGEARTGGAAGSMAMEQFPILRLRRGGNGADQ